jgi:hypothetical protein
MQKFLIMETPPYHKLMHKSRIANCQLLNQITLLTFSPHLFGPDAGLNLSYVSLIYSGVPMRKTGKIPPPTA